MGLAALAARAALLLVLIGMASAGVEPCGRVHRRSLLQTSTSTSPQGASPAPQPSSDSLTTIAVDVVEQQCTVANSYIDPARDGIRELRPPEGNARATARDCCISCHEALACNAWQWCPREGGCQLTAVAGASAPPPPPFPHLGCRLMAVAGLVPAMMEPQGDVMNAAASGFVAGTSLNVTLLQVPGYTVRAGADLPVKYDYPCASPGSNDTVGSASKCVVRGSAAQVAEVCTQDPACDAFVFYPRGVAFDGSSSVGELKGSINAGLFQPNTTSLNPAAAVYLRDAEMGPEGAGPEAASGLASGEIVAIVLASVLGVGSLAAGAAAWWYFRRYRRMMRSFPDAQSAKSEGGGGGGGERPPSAGSSGSTASGARSLHRQDSPPSVVVAASNEGPLSSGRVSPAGSHPFDRKGSSGSSGAWPYPMQPAGGTAGQYAMRDVVVAELVPGAPPSLGLGPRSGTALELLDVFSKMYDHRQAVDYTKLAELLDDADAQPAQRRQQQQQQATSGVASRADSLAASGSAAQQALPPAALDFSPDQVEMCRRSDGTLCTLGTGAFGTVYRALYRGSHPVAVKVLHRVEEPRRAEEFLREVDLLRTLCDPHVVQFMGACAGGAAAPGGGMAAMMVTELMELGDLWRALPATHPATGERIFAWRRRGRRVMEDVAKGLRYLHSKRVVHLDMKSANILLSRAGDAKIADVGMARVLSRSCLSAMSGAGTFAWSAPEVLAGRRCTEKVDVYSWGVVLWEVCTGEAPVRGDMRPLRVPEECPAFVAELQQRCVAEDPDARPTAAEILEILAAGDQGQEEEIAEAEEDVE